MADASALSGNLTLIRRQWWIPVLVALVAGGAAAAYTKTQDPKYEATMRVVVGQYGGPFDPGLGSTAEPFTQSVAGIVQSGLIARAVDSELQLPITPTTLREQIEVTPTGPESSILEVSYVSTDRREAVSILNEVARAFKCVVTDRLILGAPIGTPPGASDESVSDLCERAGTEASAPDDTPGEARALTANVFDPAAIIGQVSPRPLRDTAVALVLGLFVGLLLAYLREVRQRAREPDLVPWDEWATGPTADTDYTRAGRRDPADRF